MGEVVLGIIYFGVFLPVSMIFRLVGHDALERRIDRKAKSYWQPKARPAGRKVISANRSVRIRPSPGDSLPGQQIAAGYAPMTDPQKSFDELKEQSRSGLIAEFMYFLGQNKKWWLLPILIVIGMVGILVLLAGTGAAPLSTRCSERPALGRLQDGFVEFRLSRIVVYPIKSLDGLALDAAQVMPTGAPGERSPLCDALRQAAWISGKTNPGVHPLRAAFDQDAPRAPAFRDGRAAGEFSLSGDLAPLNAWLSDYFEEPVMVVENRRRRFSRRYRFARPHDPGPTDAGGSSHLVHDAYGRRAAPPLSRNLEFEGVAPFCEDRLVADGRHVVRFAIGEVVFEGSRPASAIHRPYARFAYGRDLSALRPPVRRARAATLPSWTVTDRFDHYYRLTVNTRLSPLSAAGEIHLGDEVRILDVVPA